MNKDEAKGEIKQGIGKAQEEWGKATDDADTQAKGEEKQAEGFAQQTWGEAKDTAKDAVDQD